MRRTLASYPLTLVASLVMALSFLVLRLVASGVVPPEGLWRALVIPAWVTMTASALTRTVFPGGSSVPYAVAVLAGSIMSLLPFFALDWVVGRHWFAGRRRRHSVAPAA